MPELSSTGGLPNIWYETKGDSSDAPLVLLHGFTGTHRTWDPLCEWLAKRHFLVLPDLPGHGRSGTAQSKAGMGVGATSDAVAEIIKAAGLGGSRKAALLGYSLGGRVALDLACRHQELLSRLVLEGASPGIERDDDRAERRAKDSALADEIERRGIEWFVDQWQEDPLFATQKELPLEVIQSIRRDRLSNSARGLAMSLRAAGTGEMTPLWSAVEGLTIPVLIVVGQRDPKFAETGEAMRERIPGSAIAVVEGAGHCVHVEKPKEFADLLEGFLVDRPDLVRATGG